jgi:hypothetical protein
LHILLEKIVKNLFPLRDNRNNVLRFSISSGIVSKPFDFNTNLFNLGSLQISIGKTLNFML